MLKLSLRVFSSSRFFVVVAADADAVVAVAAVIFVAAVAIVVAAVIVVAVVIVVAADAVAVVVVAVGVVVVAVAADAVAPLVQICKKISITLTVGKTQEQLAPFYSQKRLRGTA